MIKKEIVKKASWCFTSLKNFPPDPILSINILAGLDKNPSKVNLTVGAYKDNNGNPWVLPSVKSAINRIYNEDSCYNIEYLTLKGDLEFVDLATNLIYDYSKTGRQLKEEKKIAQLQSLSGTGALYFLLRLYKECINPDVTVYVPDPTWPIHYTLMDTLKLKFEKLQYYDLENRKFDSQVAKMNLMSIAPKSLALVQICGHNPTGFDLSFEDWLEIIEYFKQNEIDVLVDNPYQGFVSGSITEDGKVAGAFVDSGLNVMFAQSFAKNFGLYSGRVGCMSMICSSEEEAKQVESNISYMIRNTTSTLPKFGSEIIKCILREESLNNQWREDMKVMANRIVHSREQLLASLINSGAKEDWSYITAQKGMFAYTHLNKEQIHRLRHEKSIYMLDNGRMSISGINENNVDYLAKSILEITQ